MCFLPNSHASIDQAPGPIIANVALSVARMMGIRRSPAREKRIQISTKQVSVPINGVHKPIKINIDKTAPISSGKAAGAESPAIRAVTQYISSAATSTR